MTREQVIDRVETAWLTLVLEMVDGPEGWRYPRLAAAVEALREERRAQDKADHEAEIEAERDSAYEAGYEAGHIDGEAKGHKEGLASRDCLEDKG